MNELKTKASDKRLMNRVALIAVNTTILVILTAYLLEVIKGERTKGYYFVLAFIGVTQMAIAWGLFIKNKEDEKIKYILVYGYSILYTYVLLTGDTHLTTIYIYPVLSSIIIYSNKKLMVMIATNSIIANIFNVLIHVLVLHQTTASDIADYEIQIFAVILVSIFAYLACIYSNIMNIRKIHAVQDSQDVQEKLIKHLKVATQDITEDMQHIKGLTDDIKNQSASSQTAIEEIAAGTADVADNIQIQLNMSQKIVQKIEDNNELSKTLNQDCGVTLSQVNVGSENIVKLSEQSIVVQTMQGEVVHSMNKLIDSLSKAKGILDLIGHITKQTSLLALNASIEAARAGESGKGFAVVADEMSSLANDTQNATEEIHVLLGDLQKEAEKTNKAVLELAEVNEAQEVLVKSTGESFGLISNAINHVSSLVKQQAEQMSDVTKSNFEIEEKISNVSATTEELTANSESTIAMTEANLKGVEDVNKLIEEVVHKLENLNV